MGTDAGALNGAPSSHSGLDASEVILHEIVVKSPAEKFSGYSFSPDRMDSGAGNKA
jgi:hypothetical protein